MSSEAKIKALTRVQVLVEVSGGPWSAQDSFDKVAKIAKEEAVSEVRRILHSAGAHARIVGDPKATIVLVEES